MLSIESDKLGPIISINKIICSKKDSMNFIFEFEKIEREENFSNISIYFNSLYIITSMVIGFLIEKSKVNDYQIILHCNNELFELLTKLELPTSLRIMKKY